MYGAAPRVGGAPYGVDLSTPTGSGLTLNTYLHDLDFALITYGATVRDVPTDHEGLSITDRVRLLVETGQSYPHSSLSLADLRGGRMSPWELFPENPAARAAQDDLLDRIGELTHEESKLRRGTPGDPEPQANELQALLTYIDGGENIGSTHELSDGVRGVIEALREAEGRVQLRAELVGGFGLRLVSEAANDTFRDEAPTLSPTGEIASMLKVAMAFTFATRGIAIPAWADIRPLLRPTFLLPERVLDDAWRAEIREQTPAVFARKNIFIAERDLVIA